MTVVNAWRAKFIIGNDDKCHMCMVGVAEYIAHRFCKWDCRIARRAWDFSIGVMNTMKAKPRQKGPRRPLHWQHGIFGKRIPTSCSKTSKFGLLLRSNTLWTIWMDMNALTFTNTTWDAKKAQQSFGKTYLNSLELHWVWHGRILLGLPFMMTWPCL